MRSLKEVSAATILTEESLGQEALAQALGGWLAAQPSVDCVIAGATSPEQVGANVRALEWSMTPEDAAEVSAIADARG